MPDSVTSVTIGGYARTFKKDYFRPIYITHAQLSVFVSRDAMNVPVYIIFNFISPKGSKHKYKNKG